MVGDAWYKAVKDNITGMTYVQEVNTLVQTFITGIYIYNTGHSATYKYKGPTQYKI